MTLEDLGNVAELLGALAIIASLVYWSISGEPRKLLARLRGRRKTGQGSRLLIYLSSGGTCRDPMAKAITLRLLEERSPELSHIRVEGMALGPTTRPDVSFAARRAIEDLYGEDLMRDHVPKTVAAEDLDEADLVLVMDRSLLNRKVLPSAKTYLFKQFFGLDGDVEDPWPDGRDPETLSRYRESATEMKTILETNFDDLLRAMGPSHSVPNGVNGSRTSKP